MARLPRSGASFSFLYEYEITLRDVISNLGFHPLSDMDESFIRTKMGYAIGEWGRSEGDYQASDARLNIEDIRKSLEGVVTRLNEVNDFLAAAEEGLHHTHVIEVTGKIVSALSLNPEIGSVEAAQKFLADFRLRAGTVAHGTSVATWLLSTLPKPKRGRIQKDWHDMFTVAVARVCKLNAIPFVLSINRDTEEPEGKAFEVARQLERLLDPRMRAVSEVALLRRLDRSRQRLKLGKTAK